MTAIDCSDCYLAIEIGDGVKRALVRHFNRFIVARLDARGIVAAGERGREQIDRDAWRLTTTVLGDVGRELVGALDESALAADPQKGAQEILAAVIDGSVASVEQDYLGDRDLGFELLAADLTRLS
jgi:hypothetical protein